jgi:hypothetical protein
MKHSTAAPAAKILILGGLMFLTVCASSCGSAAWQTRFSATSMPTRELTSSQAYWEPFLLAVGLALHSPSQDEVREAWPW